MFAILYFTLYKGTFTYEYLSCALYEVEIFQTDPSPHVASSLTLWLQSVDPDNESNDKYAQLFIY